MAEEINDANFKEKINSTEKLVLVDFFATWCEPCTMLAPVLEKVAEDMKDKVVLLKANLDDVPNVSGQLKVEKIPTVVIFKDGKPLSGFVGLARENDIKNLLEGIIKEQSGDISGMIERYENYATANGFRLNPDKKTVERVLKGLLANEKKHGRKYCPCRRISGSAEEDAKIICPCVYHKDEIAKDGHCFCNLFVR